MRKKTYTLSLLFILILIIFTIVFLYSNLIIKILASNLVVDDNLKKADAIVLLGGGDPSRLLEAIDLYNSGYSEKIIITRGGKPEGLEYLESKGIEYPEEHEINTYIADQLNIGENTLILLPGRVYSTKEEAESIRDFSIKNGFKTLIVTTSKYHSKRSKIIFNDVFKGSDIDIIVKSSDYESFNDGDLSLNRNNWKYIIFEYQKLLYYYADELI